MDDLEIATLAYVDWFNHRRLHGELGMITPTEAEAINYRDHARQRHAERAEPGASQRLRTRRGGSVFDATIADYGIVPCRHAALIDEGAWDEEIQ